MTQIKHNPFSGEPTWMSPYSEDYFVQRAAEVYAMKEPTEAHQASSFMGMEAYSEDSWISYRKGSNGFVQVSGMIVPDAPAWYSKYGMSPLSLVRSEAIKLQADESIEHIYFLYNTPGGIARGLTDHWQFIKGLTKENTGYVLGQAASAGYFALSAHNTIVASEMAMVGSIGTIFQFDRYDRMKQNMGIDEVTVISEQSPNKNLTARGKEPLLQKQANKLTDIFMSYVANGRGVEVAQVAENFGKGDMLLASDALAVGMIDKIATLDEIIKPEKDTAVSVSFGGFSMSADNGADFSNTPDVGTTEGEQFMNIDELKQKYPDLVSQLVSESATAAQSAEQTRVSSIMGLKTELGEHASPASMKAASAVIELAIKDPKASVVETRATMFQAAFKAKDETAGDVKTHGEKVAEAAVQMGNTTPSESKSFEIDAKQTTPSLQSGFDELAKLRGKK